MVPLNSRRRFLCACRGNPNIDRTPVWYMRQAGRIFPEYRQLREEYGFRELCRTPELNVKLTCMPVRRLNVDAAIILSDILFPLEALNVDYELVSGRGPVISSPVRSREDVEVLGDRDPREVLEPIYRALEGVKSELGDTVATVGFAGAPFTLGAYLVEGERSGRFTRTKRLLYRQPDVWEMLMGRLVEVTVEHLEAQIDAGADAVQLFDSWVGELSPRGYRRFALPYSRRILQALSDRDVPTIHFGTGGAGFLDAMDEAGADVMGIDWRITLADAGDRLPSDRPVQGNLDPSLMTVPFDDLQPELDALLDEARSLPGHVFNLGHGLLPDTPLDTIQRVTDYVHTETERNSVPISSSSSSGGTRHE